MKPAITPLVERALRFAAQAHRDQARKGTSVPYLTHPAGVALILAAGGFHDEATLAAALLHDVVEDTNCALVRLRAEFPEPVPAYVDALSERKHDDSGAPRPWALRKQDYVEQISVAPLEVRAIALADKLHNLTAMVYDQESGQPIWERFNATPAEILGYYRAVLAAIGSGDPRVERLASQCRAMLSRLESGIKAR